MAAPAAGLTEDQIKTFKETFSLFDKENNGFMSLKQLELVFRSMDLNPRKDILKEFDVDGNKTLDFGEFLSLMLEVTQGTGAHSAEDEAGAHSAEDEAFKAVDKDQNGLISATELRDVMKLNQEEVDQIIKEADVDGDGQINPQEFKNM